MRDLLLDALQLISLIALACFLVVLFNARIEQMEWWFGDEEAETRPLGRFSIIRSTWFFCVAGGTFVTKAVVWIFLFD